MRKFKLVICELRWAIIALLLGFNMVAAASDEAPHEKPWARWALQNPSWVEPIAPFPIISNIYYVGTRGLASYLFTSEQGNVLLDGGLPQNALLIAESIRRLGFEVADTKLLINSHAHFDHSGGLAELKSMTGAKLIASAEDCPALEAGRYEGSDNPYYAAPPVAVDSVIADGEWIELGGIKLQANITPGHSPGCTSWTTTVVEDGKEFDVLLFCSASVAANTLVDPPQYPGIVEDYRYTFEKTKSWQPDILLAGHPFLFAMEKKLAARELGEDPGGENVFIDRAAFPALIAELAQEFEEKLLQQQNAAKR